MAGICLPKSEREKLSTALRSKDITIARLYDMTSEERNTMLAVYVGKDFASAVNARFEQAMVSNQKKAMKNWIERTLSQNDPIRRDMLKRVERVKKVLTPTEENGFLKDLAEMKVGLTVTEEEASTILKMKETIDELKAAIPENSPVRSEERLAYGLAVDDFKQFVGQLKNDADSLTVRERMQLKNWGENIRDAAGVTKSLVATLDNSFIGRQGIKVLLRGDYGLWAKTAAESFKYFGQELVQKSPGLFKDRSDAVIRAIRADI
jgi:hypothetical protein